MSLFQALNNLFITFVTFTFSLSLILTCSFMCLYISFLSPPPPPLYLFFYFLISADIFSPVTSETDCTDCKSCCCTNLLSADHKDWDQLINKPLLTFPCSKSSCGTNHFSITAARISLIEKLYTWLEHLVLGYFRNQTSSD